MNTENVRVAVTGAVYSGPLGTPMPASAKATVTGMKQLGFVGEDGVTESRERSSDAIRAWQNSAIVRESVTEASISYGMTLLESSREVLELFYGTPVGTSGEIDIDPASTGGKKAFIIDVIDGQEAIRIWIPEGEILEVGEQAYKAGEAIGYEITIKCYPTTIDGKTATVRKYYDSLKTPGA